MRSVQNQTEITLWMHLFLNSHSWIAANSDHFGDVPPRSYNLTSFEFFFGVYRKLRFMPKSSRLFTPWRRKLHQWNPATFMQNDYGNFQQNMRVEAISSICFSIHNLILYTLWINKNVVINLCFLLKLLLCEFSDTL